MYLCRYVGMYDDGPLFLSDSTEIRPCLILATRCRHTALVAALCDQGADEENHEQMRECLFV